MSVLRLWELEGTNREGRKETWRRGRGREEREMWGRGGRGGEGDGKSTEMREVSDEDGYGEEGSYTPEQFCLH